ncbi:hypothetical protein HHA03_12310 [Halolactibacillus halophilus]|uniref:Uncharacterized protein n=1 Tax=Halolactibacillus halophilus TaxID=306540 RepID=A0ABQ0VNP7_9BACI|nr:hypothetical protein HHA03_12310 [Halolactibacillus halophilus]
MKKAKIHPLTIVSLIISAIAMVTYAYNQFNNHKLTHGFILIVLAILLSALAFSGMIINHKRQ